MDQGIEFDVWELEDWQVKKGIKIEYTVVYSPEINGIAERTNGLIITKTRCLLLDSKLPQSFWPEAFDTAIYLFNRTPFASWENNIPFEKFFQAYHNDYQYSYSQNLSHLHT